MTGSTATMVARFRSRWPVADFDAWVAGAQPGARQIYGFGVSAATAAAPGVAARMRALAEAGLVVTVQKRAVRADDDPMFAFDYLAVRTAKPLPNRFPLLTPANPPPAPSAHPRTAVRTGVADRIALLDDAARLQTGGRSW